MDKLQLTGRNLGSVFNFRSGHLHALQSAISVKMPNLKLKTLTQITSSFSPVSYRAPRLSFILDSFVNS